jgi:hypothetical protein
MYLPLRPKSELAGTNPVFDRPFALSIGPQRAGTSWIDRYLRARGDICMPTGVKEVFFFDRQYSRGLDFYKNHFDPEPAHKMVMEISTTSFDHPEAPKRVLNYFGPNIRMICPLRNPITRSWSLYLHYKRYGVVTGTLQEACTDVPQILTSSHYATHLAEWFTHFGAENIHAMYQEHMDADLNNYVANLCNALQISCVLPSKDIGTRYNAAATSPVPALAKAVYDGSALLRRYKLYPVINAAKKLGLKKLILGTEKPGTESLIPGCDRAFLEDKLGGQIEAAEKLLGPLPQWRTDRPLQQSA